MGCSNVSCVLEGFSSKIQIQGYGLDVNDTSDHLLRNIVNKIIFLNKSYSLHPWISFGFPDGNKL